MAAGGCGCLPGRRRRPKPSTSSAIPAPPELDRLATDLRAVNTRLWDIEDGIRDCERNENFGDRFIRLARAVYHTNDRRADIKRGINELLGARIVEEISYTAY